jgi:hypothetical protein
MSYVLTAYLMDLADLKSVIDGKGESIVVSLHPVLVF